jgi:hypothetical protein
MKKLLTIIILINSLCIHAQTWSAIGTGIRKNGQPGSVSALFEYNGKVYTGGSFDSAGTIADSSIATWNGTSWAPVGSRGFNGYINAITFYNGDIIAAGKFTRADGDTMSNIARWNGTSWSCLGPGLYGTSIYGGPSVGSLCVYNGMLYAGGLFINAGTMWVSCIAAWNGSNWFSGLNQGMQALSNHFPPSVFCMLVDSNKLYVGGLFAGEGWPPVYSNCIGSWNGSVWAGLDSGVVGNYPTYVNAMCIYKGNLYAGGWFYKAGQANTFSLAKWNGSSWSAVNGFRQSSSITALAVYNNKLVVAGSFDSAGGTRCNMIAEWDGTTWSALGSGFRSISTVSTLLSYNGDLYVGGFFDSAGNVKANSIAIWHEPQGISEIQDKTTATLFPNPSDGVFTISLRHSVPGIVSVSHPTIEIYNMLGEKVFDATLKQVQGDNTIDLSNKASGVYLYRIIALTGTLVSTGRLVIE